MEQKNKYAFRSRISEAKFRLLVKCFAFDLDATRTAVMVNVNRNTVNRYMRLIRMRLADFSKPPSGHKPVPAEKPPVAESSAPAIRGSRKRKAHVIGILIHKGDVYTEVVSASIKPRLQSLVRGRTTLESAAKSPHWRPYRAIADMSRKRLYIVKGPDAEDPKVKLDAATAEAFWASARDRLLKFYGIPSSTFNLHLKECEFRFNNRYGNLYTKLLELLRKYPLN